MLKPLRRTGRAAPGNSCRSHGTRRSRTGRRKPRAHQGPNQPEGGRLLRRLPEVDESLLQRLALGTGHPTICTESSVCFTATAGVQARCTGGWAGRYAPRTASWSGAPTPSTPTHRRGDLLDALDRGIKIIASTPGSRQIAAKADLHLRLRPGTAGALALSMAHVIIEEGLYDAGVRRHATHGGSTSTGDYVRQFPPQIANEGITGVAARRRSLRLPGSMQRQNLRASSQARTPRHPSHNGLQNHRAITALVGLTGNYDIEGGNPLVKPHLSLRCQPRSGNAGNEDETGKTGGSDMPPASAPSMYPAWCRLLFLKPRPCTSLTRFRKERPINPVRGHARLRPQPPHVAGFGNFMEASLKKLDFLVDVDIFMTDSAKLADVILPACTSVERSEVRCYPEKYVTLTEPAIAPLGEARSDTDIVFALARRLGLDDPLLNPEPDGEADPGGHDFAGRAPRLDVRAERHDDGRAGEAPRRHAVSETRSRRPRQAVPGARLPDAVGQDGVRLVGAGAARPGDRRRRAPDLAPSRARAPTADSGPGARLPLHPQLRGRACRCSSTRAPFRLSWTRGLRPRRGGRPEPGRRARAGHRAGRRRSSSARRPGSIRVLANLTEHRAAGRGAHVPRPSRGRREPRCSTADYLDPISGFPGYKVGARAAVDKVAGARRR